MNKFLKFSWSHIVALTALIFVCYVVFMGVYYDTSGELITSLVAMGIFAALLMFTFIGAQLAKGAERRFSLFIWVERVLLCLGIVVFIAMMFGPYNHFWTVHSKSAQVIEQFEGTIDRATGMFDDYKTYADARIDKYGKHLSATKPSQPQDKTLSVESSAIRDNKVEVLRMQLFDQGYDSLKTVAVEWIQGSKGTGSVWNPFLIGNLEHFEKAITDWHSALNGYSNHAMGDEDSADAAAFDANRASLNETMTRLNSLKGVYATHNTFNLMTLTGLLVLCGLLLPYVVQTRFSKSRMSLLGRRKSIGDTSSNISFRKADDGKGEQKADSAAPSSSGDNDIYGVF